MTISTKQILSMTEANQNFSKAAKIAEQNGSAVIFKNNKPRFLLVDLNRDSYLELSDTEKIDVVARRVLEKHHKAFEELAK